MKKIYVYQSENTNEKKDVHILVQIYTPRASLYSMHIFDIKITTFNFLITCNFAHVKLMRFLFQSLYAQIISVLRSRTEYSI